MYNVRVERSAGYAGIAFIVVLILGAVIPGVPPPPGSPGLAIAGYFDAHRGPWLFGAWLTFPALALFLWFVVQLRAFLRLAPQTDDGLPTYMFAAGIATAAMNVVIGVLQVAMVFESSATLGVPALVTLYDATTAAGTLIVAPAAVMVLAASHSAQRHASLPSALVYWGYISGALMALSTLSVFFGSGFLAFGGIGGLLIGLLPFFIWVLWVSIVLIRAPRGGG